MQRSINMLEVDFLGGTIDQYNQDKMEEEGVENIIHETLKSGWGITEEKWNYQYLIMIFMGEEICFGYIHLFHPDLMATQMEVEFGEEFGTMQLS